MLTTTTVIQISSLLQTLDITTHTLTEMKQISHVAWKRQPNHDLAHKIAKSVHQPHRVDPANENNRGS